MKTTTCSGTGQPPREMVCAPEPGVRDLSHGRGVCPVCTRVLALTAQGGLRGHKRVGP